MTLTKDFVAKLAVAFVAVAMVLSAYAPAASAQETTEDLQALINDLLAQVAALQGDLGSDSSVAAGVCPYTWTRDLSSGSTGMDVMKLQQFLNADPDTRVAVSGAGSAGMETEYYGPATAAAVSKFQVKYRSDILAPLALVNPTGYYGAGSRAKANSLCVSAPVMDDEMDDEDGMEDEDEDEDEDDMELSGEASLDNMELDEGESSIEEADEDVVIGEITVEFQDGDAEISRIDVTLDGLDVDAEPWEAFDTISLWVDGDKIAEEDASDEDEYLDEDEGEIRFTNLDLMVEEDEELEILVGASVQNNLDSEEITEWTLEISAFRFFDADGVATTEQDPTNGDQAQFDIEEEGADEELNVSLASNNPDATDIVVDTDDDTNDVTVLVAELEAEDNDIEFDKVVVRVDITGGTGTSTVANVVDDVYVVIDGESFDAEAVDGNGVPSGSDSKNVDANGTSTWFVFDIDGDVTIDEDDEVDMEVVVDFNDSDDGARYANGTIIKASITGTELGYWDVEGADNVIPDGSAVGDEHTLVAEGILVPVDGFSSDVNTLGQNDTIGEFDLEFEVTAIEGDFYIYNDATEGTATTGVEFTVSGGTATATAALDSTADEDTINVFTVREGETETFTLTVTVDPAAAGTFRVSLDAIHYTEDAAGNTNTVEYTVTPATDFRTAQKAINN